MLKRSIAAGIGAVGLTAGALVVGASSASAADCWYFASDGISVCGTQSVSLTSVNGIEHTKTSQYQWTTTRLDRQIQIKSVTVKTGANSKCGTGWSLCTVINNVVNNWSAGTGTWTFKSFSWVNKWGQTEGTGQYQASNVTVVWCRGTSPCTTNVTGNIGHGSVM